MASAGLAVDRFPHDAEEWPGFLEAAQVQMADFANAVADSGQEVRLIVRNEANEARARALCSEKVVIERRVYGDVWLRDTGPLVVLDGHGGGRRGALASTAGAANI
jgi:agmatine deiminase